MTSTPTEIWENLTSTLIEEKVLLTDSGGVGEARGGLGQRIVFRNTSGKPMSVSPFGAQTLYPARGFRGGRPGSLRQILVNGKPVPSQDRLTLADGDTMTKIEPSGGGFGSPQKRARQGSGRCAEWLRQQSSRQVRLRRRVNAVPVRRLRSAAC